MSHLKKLNAEQRRAVLHGINNGIAQAGRPLLIVAGPGTGKTKTMAHRAAQLVLSGVPSRCILPLAFGRSASKELIGRTESIVRAEAPDAKVAFRYGGTFHAVAAQLMREFASQIDMRSDFEIIARDTSEELFKRILKQPRFAKAKAKLASASDCLLIHSFCENSCLSLRATLKRRYPAYLSQRKLLARLFRRYADDKRSLNMIDFDDLLKGCLAILKKPGLAERLGKRFRFVLVDEFQDVSNLQFEILKLLKPNGQGLTVVGDDAQAIYGFRGASDNFRKFRENFPGARSIVLERNYRSTQPILDACNAIMSGAKSITSKRLWTNRSGGKQPVLVRPMTEQKQAEYIARAVAANVARGISLNEQAVLCRLMAHSYPIEVELNKAGIPFEKLGGIRWAETSHVKDLIALLRWSENPHDILAATRVLCLFPEVGPVTAERLTEQVSGRLIRNEDIAPREAQADIRGLRKVLRTLKSGALDWPHRFAAAFNWYLPYCKSKHDDYGKRRADLQRLKQVALGYTSAQQFLESFIVDSGDVRDSRGGHDDRLVVSTIHSAKGREWKVVFVINAVEGCIPNIRSAKLTTDQFEEERRLLFVAISRASRHLEIISPKRVYDFRGNFSHANLYTQTTKLIRSNSDCFRKINE